MAPITLSGRRTAPFIDTSDVDHALPQNTREGWSHAQRHARIHAPAHLELTLLVGQSLDIGWSGIVNARGNDDGGRGRGDCPSRSWAAGFSSAAPWRRSTASTTPHGRWPSATSARAFPSTASKPSSAIGACTQRGVRASARPRLERQRRFTADASHELRTPLALISTEVDWALRRERQAGDYRGSLEVCQRASLAHADVVERLLALARAEVRSSDAERTPVRLDELVRSRA